MERDRARVLVLLLAYLGLVIAALFVIDWFVIEVPGGRAVLDLRTFRVCSTLGPPGDPCFTIKYSAFPKGAGWFPSLATATYWAAFGSAILVIFQAGTRLLFGHASDGLSKLGYMFGMTQLGLVVFTAYFFQPELPMVAGTGIEIHRTWAPSMLMLGHLIGVAACFYATNQDAGISDIGEYTPVTPLPEARAIERARQVSDPVPVVTERLATGPVIAVPGGLRGKLNYVALTAEITRAGIDARREDGTQLLVMWRDVVGVVARRLPPEYDGATFVDLVSTAGSTLRLVPWTRLSGDPVAGDADVLARSLIELVVSRCVDAKLDPATRKFLESTDLAAQLPDLATLAAHDQRLA